MSSLLEAANVVSNKIEITDKLPERVGDVSIMSLITLSDNMYKDPTDGYDTSTYYVYGICDSRGDTGSVTGSTPENLQAIGLDWYKQLNKPISYTQTWKVAGHRVFGGPFNYIISMSSDSRQFFFWCSTRDGGGSDMGNWCGFTDKSVYVAVVRAHE